MTGRVLPAPAPDPGFMAEISRRAGTEAGACYQCFACSGGCPFYGAMDFGPHGIMRRLQYGLRDEVLSSNTIWLCVGCHTCSALCPMAIDISAVMDVLRVLALEEGRAVPEPAVLEFHRQVLGSIERYGRTHKLEIMLRHKARLGGWLQDLDLGLRMLAKRKLDLRPSSLADPKALAHLFVKAWRRRS
ncbi:MAG: 4Fe-4S dicluster domain-containing protein [Thermodesulfobacteriota bacterium]